MLQRNYIYIKFAFLVFYVNAWYNNNRFPKGKLLKFTGGLHHVYAKRQYPYEL